MTPAALARRHCEEAGHRTVALIMNEDVKEDFAGLEETDDDPDAVIMGDLGEAFGFAILNRAFRMVIEGAELIALQKNRFWLTPEGLSLDAGPFVAAVEFASDREALVVGKPSPAFFEIVLGGLGVSAQDAAMVGDDVESDVGGAMNEGLRGGAGANRQVPRAVRARIGHRADRDGGLDRRRSRAARPVSEPRATADSRSPPAS